MLMADAIVKNDTPIEIVLFTNNHIPAEARKNIKKFQTNLEYFSWDWATKTSC